MFEDLPPRVQRLGATLRDRYGTPRNVCRALGLDAAILNEEPEEDEAMQDRYEDDDEREDDGEAVNRKVAQMLIKCAQMLSHEDTNEDDEDGEEPDESEDEDIEDTGAEDEESDELEAPRVAKRSLAQDAATLARFPHADRMRDREGALLFNFGQPIEPKPQRGGARIAQDAASRADTLAHFPHANRLRRFG